MALIGKSSKKEEFEKLYFENYAYLCHRIYRFVRDEDITKDIVQDVFLKYWQKINELRIAESPKAYLQKACINQALNYLKEKERREERERSFASMSTDNPDRPDAVYLSNETSTNIDNAINQLPPACRKTFLLSRYEQKSYKEIAKLLDISVNTVEKHIGKALKKLRALLKN
jgi:RNA polymerase sigma-70 factor (ECF subfamily)